ncbi:hypothetical protein AB3A53_004166 [Vibrio vulnificus]
MSIKINDDGCVVNTTTGTTDCETGRTIKGTGKNNGEYSVTDNIYDTKSGKFLGVRVCEYIGTGWEDGDGETPLVGCSYYSSSKTEGSNESSLTITSTNDNEVESNGDVAKEKQITGKEIVNELNNINPVNAADKAKNVFDVITSSAEIHDIVHKTNIANKLKDVNWIDFNNPYDVNSPFISNQKFAITKITAGIGKSIGLGIGMEIAKELENKGYDGSRLVSTATISFIDTILTTAVAGALSLLVAPTSAPIALAVALSFGIIVATESLVNGPYSKLKERLVDRLDDVLSSIDGPADVEKEALKKQILDMSKAFENGVNEVKDQRGNSTTYDLDRLTNSNKSNLLLIDYDANESHDNKIIASNNIDIISVGNGNDTISYQRSNSGVKVNLLTGEASGGYAEGDIISSDVENITGSSKDDQLIGSNVGNKIIAGYGNDTIITGDGNDFVVSTHELLTRDKSSKHIFFENRKYFATDIHQDIISTGKGNDVIIAGNKDYVSGGDDTDLLIISKHVFGNDKINKSEVMYENKKYTKLSNKIGSINIADDIENILIYDDEYYSDGSKTYSRGRWTRQLNRSGEISDKFWTQESDYDNTKIEVVRSNKVIHGSKLVIDFNQDGFINNFSEFSFEVHDDIDYANRGVLSSSESIFSKVGYLYNGEFTSLESLGATSIDFNMRNRTNSGVGVLVGIGARDYSALSNGYSLSNQFMEPNKSQYQFKVYYKDGSYDSIFDGNAYAKAMQSHENAVKEWTRPKEVNIPGHEIIDPSTPYINNPNSPFIGSPRFPTIIGPNINHLSNVMSGFTGGSDGLMGAPMLSRINTNITGVNSITSPF